MRAVWMTEFGGPEVLQVSDSAVPVPGPDEVLIEVEAAGVTYGDVMKRQGAFGTFDLPAGVGQEIAGMVRSSGPGGPAVGSRVAAMVEHGYAELAVAQSDSVVTLPNTVDSREAATLWIHGVTAYQTLRQAGRIRSGDTVLVHAAAGGVGTLAIQLARLLGAAVVIGTAGTPRKLDHIRAHGADFAVDYSEAGWAKTVLELTDGRGVDLVLDSVGGQISLDTMDVMASFGRIVTFGAASGTASTYPGMALMAQNLSVSGYSLMGWRSRPDTISQALEQLIAFVADDRLRPSVTEYCLDDVVEAHRALVNRQTMGSIVLVPAR
ncbi:zinc-binding dehydrogenase [Mycolicibacterium novocastrense]|uniref:Alcohol dehydrogenase zinc-binding domain protein n=1 Tax=Mycolicibacterium novocastrense TaxID=59813 RepID=A0AAW5SP44_MYCNV|nr:zinc-binding dehydrogenase [Mycolicibacterium novocastrense]MCV7025945.1 zinc-binding dehydrogenase [Mycolicibacterium novocastrense]GAT08426.1 alcohol dehydrogenase zinc-binding domain protein [Mycolicibacterium novocastrense]